MYTSKIKTQNKKEEGKKIIQGAIGLLGAMAFCQTLPVFHLQGRNQVVYSNSFHSLFFVTISAVLYFKLKRNRKVDKKRSSLSLLLSFLFSGFLVVGGQLESVDNFNMAQGQLYLRLVFCGLFFQPFLESAWGWLEERVFEHPCEIKEEKSHFFRNGMLLFLCWLPVFLAFYPGAFVYDAWDEYLQVETGEYTTHHPLLHVLLLGKTVRLGEKAFGSANVGIACYTLFQMVITALVLSYTIEFLRKRNDSKILEYSVLLFYGFFPIFPMYGVCSSKDTLFTVFLLLTLVKLLEFYREEETFLRSKKNTVLYLLAATLMLLFRNNGIYGYLLWMVVAAAWIFFQRNSSRKKKIIWVLFLTAPILLSSFINKGLAEGLQAKEGGKQEIFTVPIQQMARVYQYAPEAYSEEEKEILYEILPKDELHLYTPRISDLLKSKFDNEAFKENPGKYLSLWAKIGVRKPMIYLNAWLLTSYGYWYPDGVINVYGGNATYTISYEESSYFGFETEPPGIRDSKFPLLEKVYRKISLELFQQKIPAVSMLFSPGFLFWCYSFFMGYYLWKKRERIFLPLLLPFFIWITVLAGPTYLVRYALIWWFSAPLFVSMVKVCYTTTKITDEKLVRDKIGERNESKD